jgi:hypothetical protein
MCSCCGPATYVYRELSSLHTLLLRLLGGEAQTFPDRRCNLVSLLRIEIGPYQSGKFQCHNVNIEAKPSSQTHFAPAAHRLSDQTERLLCSSNMTKPGARATPRRGKLKCTRTFLSQFSSHFFTTFIDSTFTRAVSSKHSLSIACHTCSISIPYFIAAHSALSNHRLRSLCVRGSGQHG